MIIRLVEGVVASIEQWTQSLYKELNMEIQGTRFGMWMMKMLMEATRQKFRMHVIEVKTRAGYWGGRNTFTSMDNVKLLRFNGSMPWTVCHHQCGTIVGHNSWTAWEKASSLSLSCSGRPLTSAQWPYRSNIQRHCWGVWESLQGPSASCSIRFPV